MADWSVEEQTIPTTGIDTPIQSIGLRVNHPDAAIMIMELRADPDTYVLRFNRNGAYLGYEKVSPPAEEAAPASQAAAHAEEDEEEEHTKASATKPPKRRY